ncbi:uncharacterized protein, partial [Zea mays]|uniref:uncharacterized protein n=1 Tax=Zea mays TaxID=4577 RepID=UPI0004DE9D17
CAIPERKEDVADCAQTVFLFAFSCVSVRPKSLPGINFIKVLTEHEDAFDVLYCIAFEMMDAQWLAMRASYMQFKEVLKATRQQHERELSLEDLNSIHDLPACNLLYK